MKWEDHTAWVTSRLGEYRVAGRPADTLRLRRMIEGDTYTLVLSPRSETGSSTVAISFEATPF